MTTILGDCLATRHLCDMILSHKHRQCEFTCTSDSPPNNNDSRAINTPQWLFITQTPCASSNGSHPIIQYKSYLPPCRCHYGIPQNTTTSTVISYRESVKCSRYKCMLQNLGGRMMSPSGGIIIQAVKWPLSCRRGQYFLSIGDK